MLDGEVAGRTTPLLRSVGSGMSLVVRGGTLIDGTGAAPLSDSMVLIKDGRIERIGQATERPPDAHVQVDARKRWIVPGLVDCHVHLNGERTWEPYRRYLDPPARLRPFLALRDATQALFSGFMTVRDVGIGHGIALRMARQQGLAPLPRILAAHTALTTTGGHGDWPYLPYEFVSEPALRGTLVDGPDACRLAVRRALREGANLIKIMLTSGGVTNHPNDLARCVDFSMAEVRAVVDEAHRRGARVAAHSFGALGARTAAMLGVDTVEHGVLEPDARLLEKMAARGIALVPTLLFFEWVADHGEAVGLPAERVNDARRVLETQFGLVHAAHRAGVDVVVGSNSSGLLAPEMASRELHLLSQAGLSAMAALVAATQAGARACGLEAEIGTIARGKRADLLILSQDPLADLTVLQRPGTVCEVIQSAAA